MRFINTVHTPFENMAFCYHELEEAPTSTEQVLRDYHKIRGIFDPRIDTVYIRSSTEGTNIRSPFIPARYDIRPETFKDLIFNGFPYKTYSDAQQALMDTQRSDNTYMVAPRVGKPPANQKESYRRLTTIDWTVTGSGSGVSMKTNGRTLLADFSKGTSGGWITISGTDNGSALTSYPHRRNGLDTRMFSAGEKSEPSGVILLIRDAQIHNFKSARPLNYYADGAINTIPHVAVTVDIAESQLVEGKAYHERFAQHFTIVQNKIVALTRTNAMDGNQLLYRTDPILNSNIVYM